jgi:transportin-1
MHQRLEELRFNPDFLAYLALVLIHQQNELDSHRAVAGLLLKNSILQRNLNQENASEGERQAVAYVKDTILAGLQDKDQMIRQTVGAVITSLLSAEEPGAWPQALEALTTGKGSQDTNVVEVSQFSLSVTSTS